MSKQLPKDSSGWPILLLEGIIQLVLGFFLVFSTDITLIVLIEIIGIYWLIRGIIMFFQAFASKNNFGWMLLGSILGIIAGIVVLRYPLFSGFILMEFLVVIIALIGLIQGTISIIRGLKNSVGELILGILLWIIGLLLLFNPLGSIMALVMVIGVLWMIGGIALIILAFYVRK